ncbi:hypothetical protein KFU94_46890 [Chloroflexi bacterium TSY]|nr:hypothetical protein [Chloroflexi bacterium TSY]
MRRSLEISERRTGGSNKEQAKDVACLVLSTRVRRTGMADACKCKIEETCATLARDQRASHANGSNEGQAADEPCLADPRATPRFGK